MSDEEDDSGPVVELGEETPVEGVPLARVTSRLHWPIEKSEIGRHEGDAEIRTPDGPQTISTILEDISETYFQRRQEFESHVRDVIGTGPVGVAGDGGSSTAAPESDVEDAADAGEGDGAETDADEDAGADGAVEAPESEEADDDTPTDE